MASGVKRNTMPRIARVAQVVCDLSGEQLADARVLDLGCNTGGFSLELARRGAGEVLAIDGREENMQRGIQQRDAEGLRQVEFTVGDIRDIDRERHGAFDVVLCLGVLYHLDVPAVFDFLRRLASVTRGFALIETQTALSPRAHVSDGDKRYSGIWYAEDVRHHGASLDNPRSFWPTRASLLNMLSDAGFTSVSEVLQPFAPDIASYRDHVLFLAHRGEPQAGGERWPEKLPMAAAPAQGPSFWLRDRIARLRGGGVPSFFR